MSEYRQSINNPSANVIQQLPLIWLLVGLGLMTVVGLTISVSAVFAASFFVALVGLGICLALAIRQPIWLIYGLVLFMPFENVILKYIPGPDQLYLAARFGVEIVIYTGFIVVVIRHMVGSRPFRSTPVDLPLLIFLGLALLSILFNRSITADAALNLRALLRYIALFYWIVNLDISERQATLILRIILITAVLQVGIGALQYLAKGRLDPILMPRASDLEIAGETRSFRLTSENGREFGAIYGTLGDTLYFGLFMLIALGVYLSTARRLTFTALALVGAMIVAIAFSYSRAATFGVALVFALFAWSRFGSVRMAKLAVPLVPLLLIAILLFANSLPQQDVYLNPTRTEQSVLENMTGIFSASYINNAQKQRLGALLQITPVVLTSRPLLGYGPSVGDVVETLNEQYSTFFGRPIVERGFEDVYWVAMLTYYGILGVLALAILIVAMFLSAFRIARTTRSRQIRRIAIASACIVGLTPFLLFFYRVLEFRIFSFYFWLLPGLLYARRATLRQERAEQAQRLPQGG